MILIFLNDGGSSIGVITNVGQSDNFTDSFNRAISLFLIARFAVQLSDK